MTNKEIITDVANQEFVYLTDEEIEKYAGELDNILKFTEKINEVNTDNIKMDVAVLNQCNAFRKDEIVEYGDRDALLQNAPKSEDGMYQIPKVIN